MEYGHLWYHFKILSGRFLEFRKVKKVDTSQGHWLGGVSVHHGLALRKVCSPAIFETCNKDILIAATDYYI